MGLLGMLALVVALADPRLDAARSAYVRGDYKSALSQLGRVEKSPSLDDDSRARAAWYRGLCELALGNRSAAESSFDRLLDVMPYFEPDPREAAPHIRAMLRARADRYFDERAPLLTAPSLVPPVFRVAVTARREPVPRVVVHVRARGQQTFQAFPLDVTDGKAELDIQEAAFWKTAAEAHGVEVIVEARRDSGTVLARLGDGDHPLAFDVTTAPILASVPPEPAPATRAEPVSPSSPNANMKLLWLGPAAFSVVAGLLVLTALVSLGIFSSTGALLSVATTPRREPWFEPVLGSYRAAFWVGLSSLALLVAVLPLGAGAVAAAWWFAR